MHLGESEMRYQVYLEDGIEGKTLAWVLAYPGCYNYGATVDEALAGLPAAINDYWAWRASHGDLVTPEAQEVEIEVVETFTVTYDGDYEINAFFTPDRHSPSEEEIEEAFRLLTYSRADLLALIADLPDEAWEWRPEEGCWSIRRILRHIGDAEAWYISRLGVDPGDHEMAGEVARLTSIRRMAMEQIRVFPPEKRAELYSPQGELWTLRKILRRFIWHERDHLQQIANLVAQWSTRKP
jgi:uncharacterized damage-inducible protein DinB